MDLITLVVVLAVVGCVLYIIETSIPMAPPFKIVIRVIIVLALVLYLLRAFNVPNLLR